MYLSQDYQDIIEIFNEHGVRYIIVGAYAMTVFGYARSTYDIDLWIDRNEENVPKVIEALEEFGVPFSLSVEELSKENQIIQIGIVPNRIDILTNIDGVDFDEAWRSKETFTCKDMKLPILSIEHLKQNKKASGRSKDKIDLIELEKLSKY